MTKNQLHSMWYSMWYIRNLREELHGVGLHLDALLTIFGEISQHFQRLHTYGDLILVRPDLQSNEHHTRVQLVFEDLSLKCAMSRNKKDRERERESSTSRRNNSGSEFELAH